MAPGLLNLPRMRVLCAIAVVAMCGTSPGAHQAPAGDPLSGPVVKAVYLLNFARFTEWPSRTDGRLALCVLGDPQVAAILDRLVGGRPINGREVSVARIETLRIVQSCHLLYVTGEGQAHTADTLQAVADQQVFTVGDGETFTRAGGVAALYTEEGRIRFAINSEALNRAGLRVSAQMLGLARLVKGQSR